MSEELRGLLPYATPRQAEVLQARIDGLSVKETGQRVGISERNVYRHISAVRSNASKHGHSPAHDMTHTVPEGFNVKGVSTYYDENGKPKGQWVKSQADREKQLQILLERLEEGSSNFKPFKPTKEPRSVDDDLLTLITITDFHLGMYAWEAETGEAWDVNISRDVLLNAVNDMIDASPKSQVGVLNQLGDFLHFDSLLAITPTSGHIQDADTRYGKLVDLALSVMTETVRLMLKKFGEVIVIQAEGNHDMAGSIWLRKHLKHVFSDEPRVTVDDTEFPYYAQLHGEIMLGFHHGHKMKLAQLHKLFASEPRYRAMWGQAKQTYIHAGHLHHERVVEDGGAIAEQHPTLAARDAYSTRGGWVSMRGAKAITYHKVRGEEHRVTVRPRLGSDEG